MSDIDDPVGDAEYQPSQQEPSSSEEDSSGCEDPLVQPTKPIRGRKRLHDKYTGHCSACNIARSRTPKHHSRTQQDEANISNNVPEEIKPGPSHQEQSRERRGK